MSEQQYLWAPTPDKPKRGRVWLIVVLSVVALLIVGGVLWLLLRPGTPDADPAATTSPSSSASPSPSESATPSAEPSASPSSAPSSEPTPPMPPAPDLTAFRANVAPVLADAHRGLQYATDEDPQQAAQDIGLLQEDAGRLKNYVTPASISSKWTAALSDYSTALKNLRAAYDGGRQGTSEMASAKKALDALDAVIR